MIELSRALARQFRSMLRRSVLESRGSWPVVLCRANGRGLTLQATQGELALRYHEPGKRVADTIAFRATVLVEFEGRNEGVVVIEQVAAGKGRARWQDGGVPREVNFDTVLPDDFCAFPEPPAKFVPMPAEFLDALDAAAHVAGENSTRLALSRVQLRGKQGEIVATDGRQLLVQGGFTFPWSDDVLVPGVPSFPSGEFTGDGDVGVGRTKTHVVVKAGPWALLLAIDATSRYPDVEVVIPRQSQVKTRLQLDAEDATFLAAALPKLPGNHEDPPTITIDLGKPPAIRARGEGQEQATEVVLARSKVSGPPVLVHAVRSQLARGLKLGFRQVEVISPDKPLLFRDARRLYLCMPLSPASAIPRDSDRQCSRPRQVATAPSTLQTNERTTPTMSATQPNGTANGHGTSSQPERWGIAEVIAETEALRNVLNDASARTSRLLAALKHQRRKSKAVQTAMASLRQLKLDP